MQYVLCPRCKFRVSVNKHICATCGYTIPAPESGGKVGKAASRVARAQKPGFWQQFLGLTPVEEEHGSDPAQEEPALG